MTDQTNGKVPVLETTKPEDMTFAERNRELEKLLDKLDKNIEEQKELVKRYKGKILELEEIYKKEKQLYKDYEELVKEREEKNVRS